MRGSKGRGRAPPAGSQTKNSSLSRETRDAYRHYHALLAPDVGGDQGGESTLEDWAVDEEAIAAAHGPTAKPSPEEEAEAEWKARALPPPDYRRYPEKEEVPEENPKWRGLKDEGLE